MKINAIIKKYTMVIALIYIFLLPRLGDYIYSVAIHRALMIIMTAIPASVVAAMPYTALSILPLSAATARKSLNQILSDCV